MTIGAEVEGFGAHRYRNTVFLVAQLKVSGGTDEGITYYKYGIQNGTKQTTSFFFICKWI